MPKARGTKQIAANRKAFHEYFVDEPPTPDFTVSEKELFKKIFIFFFE